MKTVDLLGLLPKKCHRGSKPRCHLLLHGGRVDIAARLTELIRSYGEVRPNDCWMPDGFANLEEAQLHKACTLLEPELCQQLCSWWLSVTRGMPMTPNWDIASTCLIEGKKGILLIEAKAHDEELIKEAKGRTLKEDASANSIKNFERIGKAINEANVGLNKICPGWNLSQNSHYQMSNRFAWSWKLATLGIPVVLVYLGFLNANEMQDQGQSFKDGPDWKNLVLSHGKAVVPESVWETRLTIKCTTIIPLIRTSFQSLG